MNQDYAYTLNYASSFGEKTLKTADQLLLYNLRVSRAPIYNQHFICTMSQWL